MAKLGSSVDAGLSRISPYAIRAIEQGGASMGAGYAAVGAGLGKAITSIMHQTEESRIDEILNEALMPQEGELRNVGDDTMEILKPVKGTGHQPYTPVLDSEGKPTTYSQLDEKAIRSFLSDKKVFGRNISEKRIASFLKQERDSIDSNNTTQLAFDTYEANQEAQAATIAHREAVEATRLAEVEKATLLETQRYDALVAKQKELDKKYDRIINSNESDAKAKREAKEAKEANSTALLGFQLKSRKTDPVTGDPVMSLEEIRQQASQLEKMMIDGTVKDNLLGQQFIRYQSELDERIGVMESLATADAGGVVDEPWEVKLENAGNQMRKTLEAELSPERLGQYRGYLQDGQESETSRAFLGDLKNKLEAQGGKFRPGSKEVRMRDSIDLYLTTFENPDVSVDRITSSYESPEERQRRLEQRNIDRMMMMGSGP